jgi:hypothetical protein
MDENGEAVRTATVHVCLQSHSSCLVQLDHLRGLFAMSSVTKSPMSFVRRPIFGSPKSTVSSVNLSTIPMDVMHYEYEHVARLSSRTRTIRFVGMCRLLVVFHHETRRSYRYSRTHGRCFHSNVHRCRSRSYSFFVRKTIKSRSFTCIIIQPWSCSPGTA